MENLDLKVAVIAINDAFCMPSETGRVDRKSFKEVMHTFENYQLVTSSITYMTLPKSLQSRCIVVHRNESLPKGRVCILGGPKFIEGHWDSIGHVYINWLIGQKDTQGGQFYAQDVLKILSRIRKHVPVSLNESISERKQFFYADKVFHLAGIFL